MNQVSESGHTTRFATEVRATCMTFEIEDREGERRTALVFPFQEFTGFLKFFPPAGVHLGITQVQLLESINDRGRHYQPSEPLVVSRHYVPRGGRCGRIL